MTFYCLCLFDFWLCLAFTWDENNESDKYFWFNCELQNVCHHSIKSIDDT